MTKSIDRGQIKRRWTEQRQTFLLPALTTSSAFYARATEVIKPVHALMINMEAFHGAATAKYDGSQNVLRSRPAQ